MLFFDKESLKESIRHGDPPALQDPRKREWVAALAALAAKNGLHNLPVRPIRIKGKSAYTIKAYIYVLILRRLNSALKISKQIKPPDRDAIVRQLSTVLAEGVPHRVYKLDIQAFFESIDTADLLTHLSKEKMLSRASVALLGGYFSRLQSLGVVGLPRGVALSSTLAECRMRDFDLRVSKMSEVYYFARYVDDIVVVTSAKEDKNRFRRNLQRALPAGLRFNSAKTIIRDIPMKRRPDKARVLAVFDYLGYRFHVHEHAKEDNGHCRQVRLEIAPKKLQRLRTRISHAFLEYVRSGDRNALLERLRMLSGNYNRREFSSGRIRNVGLYCNYRRASNNKALQSIDGFIRAMTRGNKTRLARLVTPMITEDLRSEILKISFAKSFEKRIFYNFDPSRFQELSSCWRDV